MEGSNMTICSTKSIGCKNEIAVLSFWPNKPPVFICLECAARRDRIAKTLGLVTHHESIERKTT